MRESKPWGYWNNKENCYNAALECETKMEFVKKYITAYQKAMDKGWIADYTWFKSDRKPRGFWLDYNNCFEAAKECTCRSQLIAKYYQAYVNSIKNDWIVDYTWFRTPDAKNHEEEDFSIYLYEFTDYNSVYVGITCNQKARDASHRRDENSAVFKFAKKVGTEIPEMRIVMTDLSGDDAQWAEGWYVDACKKEGKNVLNKAKTGSGSSSLGGAVYKWDEETCLKAARDCETKREFYEKYPGALAASKKKNWYKSYTWLKESTMPKGYWNSKENCIEAAQECETKSEFKKKYYQAWWNCLRNNWMDEIQNHFVSRVKESGYWNYDNCLKAAKECKTRNEFKKKYGSAYVAAIKHGWYDEISSKCFEHVINPRGYWTHERCEEECKKYKCISEVKKNSSACYSSMYKHGWLHDFFNKES